MLGCTGVTQRPSKSSSRREALPSHPRTTPAPRPAAGSTPPTAPKPQLSPYPPTTAEPPTPSPAVPPSGARRRAPREALPSPCPGVAARFQPATPRGCPPAAGPVPKPSAPGRAARPGTARHGPRAAPQATEGREEAPVPPKHPRGREKAAGERPRGGLTGSSRGY